MNENRVRKYLDASTGCLPESEMRGISEHDRVIHTDHGYGVWVWVPPDDGDEMHDVSKELPHLDAIFKLARSLDCDWINFDRDGEPLEGLPTFEW